MSDISANIIVESINLNIERVDPGITITSEPIDLNIYTGGYACAQGNTTEVQYNAGGALAGAIGLKYYVGNSTTEANALVVAGNANIGNLNATGNIAGNNISVTGNISSNNLSVTNTIAGASANITGNITANGNINSLANITALNANLGNLVTANFFTGNGALLTGIDTSKISNGNSNVSVIANGNITISSGGVSNVVVITNTGLVSNSNITFTGANVSLGNVSNLEILGGSNGFFLRTDGAGNLDWALPTSNFSNFAGTVTGTNQPNITALGSLSILTVVGSANLGNVSNIIITGGNNGYFLQTDGAGNLSWVTGGGTGNGVVGGANTQIQFNDQGNFAGAVGFTFDNVSNTFSTPGDANIAGTLTVGNLVASNSNLGNLSGILITANQPNITNIGNLTSLNVVGTTSIQQAKEKVQANNTPASFTVDFDILTSAIYLKTADANSNFTLNIRGNSNVSLDTIMSSNESLTCTFINVNGANAYIANNIQIESTTANTIWFGNISPTAGTVNGFDIYTFNIIKLAANSFIVFGSIGSYG